MAFSNGEYIKKFILPALVHTLQNLQQDFLAVIPNAPKAALNSSGINVHKVGNPISVDWDKMDAYVDGDRKTFDVENNTIPWQYFSTTPSMTDSEEIRTSALNRGGILKQKHGEAIVVSWVEKNIHALAPDDDTDPQFNPVFETTGPDRGDGSGTRRMLLTDVIKAMLPYQKMNLTKMGELYMILSPEHLNDLCLDALGQQAFRDIFIKTMSGEPVPHHGWKFFINNASVKYAVDGTKKAIGAAAVGTDRVASTIFYAPHAIKAIYNVKQHYTSMEEDTRNNPPIDELRFTGNATVGKLYEIGFGAIKDGNV
ncbi:hypothetical protein [Reichenbachiella sp.]|uniref:hypothetical protein n=1 Tax=Reichenbachiella sp. TaxID=2184521 RepID=UPI003B5B8721